MSDDFNTDLEIELAVRGIDTSDPEQRPLAWEVARMLADERQHAARLQASHRAARAIRELQAFLGERNTDLFSTADVVRLFRDPQLKHAFELAVAAMNNQSRPSAPKEMD